MDIEVEYIKLVIKPVVALYVLTWSFLSRGYTEHYTN